MQKQDLNIFFTIEKNSKGVVILVNKWDLVEKSTQTMKEFEDTIRERIAPYVDVPILFISTLTKQRIHKAVETAMQVHENMRTRISTSKLNDVMQPILESHPPPQIKGKFIKIKYVMQLPTHKPAFAFFCNLPQYVKDPYKRFLENKLRENFDLTGIPIKIFIRQK